MRDLPFDAPPGATSQEIVPEILGREGGRDTVDLGLFDPNGTGERFERRIVLPRKGFVRADLRDPNGAMRALTNAVYLPERAFLFPKGKVRQGGIGVDSGLLAGDGPLLPL